MLVKIYTRQVPDGKILLFLQRRQRSVAKLLYVVKPRRSGETCIKIIRAIGKYSHLPEMVI